MLYKVTAILSYNLLLSTTKLNKNLSVWTASDIMQQSTATFNAYVVVIVENLRLKLSKLDRLIYLS